MYSCMHRYRGIAFYGLKQMESAEVAFSEAIENYPNDTRAWLNLGESQTLNLKFDKAIVSYTEAYKLGDRLAISRLSYI